MIPTCTKAVRPAQKRGARRRFCAKPAASPACPTAIAVILLPCTGCQQDGRVRSRATARSMRKMSKPHLQLLQRYVDALNPMQRYLVTEFVDNYEDGLMSRRDLLERVYRITGSV